MFSTRIINMPQGCGVLATFFGYSFLFFPSVYNVVHREKRVMQEHAWICVSHDLFSLCLSFQAYRNALKTCHKCIFSPEKDTCPAVFWRTQKA
jgi:hypothetical protein